MQRIFRTFLFCLPLLSCAFHCQAESGNERTNPVRKAFYEGYKEWIEYRSKPGISILSGFEQFDCDGMRKIIALGLPAVPIILEAMHNDKEGKGEFHLQYALKKITKVHFGNDIVGEKYSMSRYLSPSWEMWYRHSDRYTKTEFKVLLAARRGFDHQEHLDLLEEVDQRITNIGVFVLPYLIDEISKGESGLIPIVSKLSDEEISVDASADDCKYWWEKNKERFAKPYNQGHFDTFRTWTIENGKWANRAKYLSATDSRVTLEKEDGTIIEVELAKLSGNDQAFVEWQRARQLRTTPVNVGPADAQGPAIE